MEKNNHIFTDEIIPGFHHDGEQQFFLILIASIIFYSTFALWAYSVPTPEIEVPLFPRETPRTARFILPAPEPKKETKPIPKTPPLPAAKKTKSPPAKKPEKPINSPAIPQPPTIPKKVPESDRDIALKSGLLKLLSSRTPSKAKDPQAQFPPIESLKPPSDLLDQDNIPLTFQEDEKGEAGLLSEVDPDVSEFSLSGKTTTVIDHPFKILGAFGGEINRSEESILKVIQAHQNGLTYLYNRALVGQPDLKGTITVEFTILASGEVARLKITSSTLNHKEFERSIRKHIQEWRFERISEGEVVVIYPIGFTPA